MTKQEPLFLDVSKKIGANPEIFVEVLHSSKETPKKKCIWDTQPFLHP